MAWPLLNFISSSDVRHFIYCRRSARCYIANGHVAVDYLEADILHVGGVAHSTLGPVSAWMGDRLRAGKG